MPKFPVDAPRRKVLKALEKLGFEVVRDREHTALIRRNPDGTATPLTIPAHDVLNSGTLHAAPSGCGISSAEFIRAYYSK